MQVAEERLVPDWAAFDNLLSRASRYTIETCPVALAHPL